MRTKEDGITLIALIITITILIILSAVVIMSFTEHDMVRKSVQGTEDYAQAQQDEAGMFDGLKEFLDDEEDRIQGKDAPVYVVDKAKVGDYIDIGIDYTNKGAFDSGNVSDKYSGSGMKGWRVLEKSGNGSNGVVKLVAAGRPLTFYFKWASGQADLAINSISDLITNPLQMVATGTQGFVQNGLGDNNLKNVFSKSDYVDIGKGVHGMTVAELESAYKALSGGSKNITALSEMTNPLKTATLKEQNKKFDERGNDLLGIGSEYYLGGTSYESNFLWAVDTNGGVTYTMNSEKQIRPVITLKTGLVIAEDNEGNGRTSETAYKISEK